MEAMLNRTILISSLLYNSPVKVLYLLYTCMSYTFNLTHVCDSLSLMTIIIKVYK